MSLKIIKLVGLMTKHGEVQALALPDGAVPRFVTEYGGAIALHYECDSDAEVRTNARHRFMVAWSGREFDPKGGKYIGSVQLGVCIAHVFWGCTR